jgi:uncharacterized protein (DUF1330 family)
MPAYVIALEVIEDRKEFDRYRAGVHDILKKFRGEILASSEDFEVVEGTWPYTKTVVIRFPSMEQAKRWYNAPEYQEVAKHRFRSTKTDLIFIEGRQ